MGTGVETGVEMGCLNSHNVMASRNTSILSAGHVEGLAHYIVQCTIVLHKAHLDTYTCIHVYSHTPPAGPSRYPLHRNLHLKTPMSLCAWLRHRETLAIEVPKLVAMAAELTHVPICTLAVSDQQWCQVTQLLQVEEGAQLCKCAHDPWQVNFCHLAYWSTPRRSSRHF